jgi:ethanolamine utilization protein EutA
MHQHAGGAHEHEHDGPHEHGPHDHRAVWGLDNVELETVGIDIGSSTSHFMFARVHMQRLAATASSRFEVVARDVVWQSPILLTPYRSDDAIDAEQLAQFFDEGYRSAGIDRCAVDAGAVILTGEALKRRNARAIADLFASDAGKFVCASAGHHLECAMGAHGSGAVRLSEERRATLLNVDIGGGTSKFSVIRAGRIVGSTALAIGARLLVTDAQGRVLRVEEPLLEIAQDAGVTVRKGEILGAADRERLVGRMVEVLAAMIERASPGRLARKLLLTQPWAGEAATIPIEALTFSGGVAEYLYGREACDFGDFGRELAQGIRAALAGRPLWDPGQGIRATVTGAAQFSVQVSGSTISIPYPERLPLRNLPVLTCAPPADEVDPQRVTAEIRAALTRSDLADGDRPFALAFAWDGSPSYARLGAFAAGIAAAVPATLANGLPLALLIDGDVGLTLGRILSRELSPKSNVIGIDGIQLKEFDYVDIGAPIEPADVVPVTIKSLLF